MKKYDLKEKTYNIIIYIYIYNIYIYNIYNIYIYICMNFKCIIIPWVGRKEKSTIVWVNKKQTKFPDLRHVLIAGYIEILSGF